MRWRAFCDELLGVIRELDVQMVVTLGALLSDTPHTRPTQVTGTAYDPESAARYGLERSRYEGPTGIVGVLQDACVRDRHPGHLVLGRRAALRLAAAEPEGDARAAARRRGGPRHRRSRWPSCPQQSDEWQKLVDEMAAEDDEVTEYIRNLEERDDEIDRTEMHEASGDAIAREFERYLRRRDRGGGGFAGGGPRG